MRKKKRNPRRKPRASGRQIMRRRRSGKPKSLIVSSKKRLYRWTRMLWKIRLRLFERLVIFCVRLTMELLM